MDVDGPYESQPKSSMMQPWTGYRLNGSTIKATGRDNLWHDEDGNYVGAIVGHDPGSVIEW